MGAGSALIALIYKVEPISRNGPIFRGAFTLRQKASFDFFIETLHLSIQTKKRHLGVKTMTI